MASDVRLASGHLAMLSWYLNHAQHSVWDRFSSDQQRQMVEDDLTAGISVSLLLYLLIMVGLTMSIISMSIIWAVS